MKILVNASNLKRGGGLQVADSFCCLLNKYPQHKFIVVLSRYLIDTAKVIEAYSNVNVIFYDIPKTISHVLSGRDKLLDQLVDKEKIEVVLTIFGPSLWIPKVPHVSGFARPHCVLTDSPYFSRMGWREYIKSQIERKILIWDFKRCADVYFTENRFITEKLRRILKNKKVYTVTNYYNQIFDSPERWTDGIKLPAFSGITLLTIGANYPHKNFSIIAPTIKYLQQNYPTFEYRFVLTISESELHLDDEFNYRDKIIFLGKVPLSECPNLYNQCDIVFSPTLLECFSAVYPEAMRMSKPIITTDLAITRSLCGDAALYYNALSPEAFGDAIYCMANDPKLRKDLIDKGKQQLMKYDNYDVRAEKLIKIMEVESSVK